MTASNARAAILFSRTAAAYGRAAGADHIPHSVQSIVSAYLDRLEAEDRQAARAASVLGQRFSLAALRHLVGDPRLLLQSPLAKYLVRPWGEQYLFTHALIAEGIYGSLPNSNESACTGSRQTGRRSRSRGLLPNTWIARRSRSGVRLP